MARGGPAGTGGGPSGFQEMHETLRLVQETRCHVAKALGDIARAKGMAQVARDAGLSRESLYKALSGERSPGFDTILKVIGALGLKLHAEVGHS